MKKEKCDERFQLDITITGETENDLLVALDEIKKQISDNCVSGMNSNETGEYNFQKTIINWED